MTSQNQAKAVFYEVNPRYFYDANHDGIGDLAGLIAKFDYFTFLGVNALILQNVLASDSKNAAQSYLNVASEIGSTDQLREVLALGKTHGIRIFLELNIGTITEANRWFTAASATKDSPYHDLVAFSAAAPQLEDTSVSVKSAQTGEFYVASAATHEVPLNWDSAIVSTQFLKVIKAWHALGVTGFVLKNFELIGETTKTATTRPMSEATRRVLREFYLAIKAADEQIVVIGKGGEVNYASVNSYTRDDYRLFDFFYPTNLALLGTKNNSVDEVGKFSPAELASALNLLAANSRNIIAFGSAAVGRIASRWGDEGQFHFAAAKTLAALLLIAPAASLIYYGDELGTKNIGLSVVDDFQDQSLEVRKKAKVSARYSEAAFMAAQVLQNPVNARSLMAWNESAHGGFSTSAKTITPLPASHRSLNVAAEFADTNSIMQFYRRLIALVTSSIYANDIARGTYQVKALRRNVLRARLSLGAQQLTLYANFSNAPTRVLFKPRGAAMLAHSYSTKTYQLSALAREFEPWETFLLAQVSREVSASPAQKALAALESKVLSEAPRELTQPISAAAARPHEVASQAKTSTRASKAIKGATKPIAAHRAGASFTVREATQITELKPVALPQNATSLTSVEKQRAQREAEALSKINDYEGITRLSDAEVAKTTQVDVNAADDIEAFLRALDKRRK